MRIFDKPNIQVLFEQVGMSNFHLFVFVNNINIRERLPVQLQYLRCIMKSTHEESTVLYKYIYAHFFRGTV
jgi:hypothetical protein